VLHAFADPGTIDDEALAISPGVMVVASGSTLPFSPTAVEALVRARAAAHGGEVAPREVLVAALGSLGDEALAALGKAGLVLAPAAPAPLPDTADDAEPLFRRFTTEAKRALSNANRAAAQSDEPSIGPARLVIACLERDEELASEAGLAWRRARLALTGHTLDATPPRPRALPADEALLTLLGRLPEGASSTAVLGEMIASGPLELGQILTRHKVTTSLIERARDAFGDP
jgi:hypothetical protein